MKRYSIKQQIFLWVSFIVILVIVLNIIFNNFILDKIYIYQQKREIIEIYNQLSKKELSKEDLDDLYKECSLKNITLFVTDSNFKPIFYSYDNYGDEAEENLIEDMKNFYEKDIDTSAEQFKKDLTENKILMNTIPKEHTTKHQIVEQNDFYTIYRTEDIISKTQNMELTCTLSKGNMLLIRVSIDSINDNLNLFNTISSVVLLLGLGMGICLSWFLCQKISNPVKELTNISEEMIKFNFDSKYNFQANNEIDILGKNFNTLSSELNKTLSELKEANVQLEKDIEEKIRIDTFRKEFISNVSHELKTPIALIQGYAEALKEGIGDDKETNDYYLDIIMDESLRMNKLVKQLIDLNQLESDINPVSLEEFDVSELIKGIASTYTVMAKEKDAEIILNFESEKIMVLADEFKIEQVIINYFTNALNHIDFDKKIIVNVFTEGENVKITVFNNGKPIPDEDINNIWLKFYKVDKARTRAYGGSGIGLSIVKAIMESLGQDFGVENNDNGVTFWFTLKKVKDFTKIN